MYDCDDILNSFAWSSSSSCGLTYHSKYFSFCHWMYRSYTVLSLRIDVGNKLYYSVNLLFIHVCEMNFKIHFIKFNSTYNIDSFYNCMQCYIFLRSFFNNNLG